MEDSGSVAAIASFMTQRLGPQRAVLAVVLAGALVTYGGVSLFVAFFVLAPMAQGLFRAAGIPRRLMPAAIVLGTSTFTMSALPGTPSIQNAIPMPFFGTTPFAAPGLGILASSSDLPTHIELYKHFPNIGGVAHTHSEFATAWAQAETPIPCFGTTHADSFHGPIPVTARLSTSDIEGDYELETGAGICRAFAGLDPDSIPAVLVAGHAPFCWGPSAAEAAHNAVILEYVAKMASHTISIDAESRPLARELHDKHFLRKHGHNAYYGQVKTQ